MKELTLDWDVGFSSYHTSIKWKAFCKFYKQVKETYGAFETWVRKSPSGRTHVKLIFERDMNILDSFMVRAIFTDDYARLVLDLKRAFIHGPDEINRLFDFKVVNGEQFVAGAWTRLPIDESKMTLAQDTFITAG